MAEYPDIYVDGFAIGVGPFGVTVTFQRSDPPVSTGVSDKNDIVGRVRMSPAFAKAFAQALNDSLAQQGNIHPESPTKH